MAPVALAFAVLDSSGPGDLGLVLAARMVPLLAFLLLGGATADRFSRRTVLAAANLGSGLAQAGVAALVLTGRYSTVAVAVLELFGGASAAFTTPALRGIVPQLVGGSGLRRANSLLASARNGTKILGPSLSGVLVVAAGSGPAIAFDALTYLVAAACFARLPAGAVRTAKTTVLADLREGWTEFRRLPWVWLGTAAFFVVNLVQTGTWQVLGPALTRQLSGETTWGYVLSARGAGLLVMSALLYRLAVRHLLRLGWALCSLGALPFLALGAGAGAPWLIAAAFVAGLGISAVGVAWETSLAEHVPTHALSRVSSYGDLLSYLAIPIGQLGVGPLAGAFGGFAVVAAAGILYAAVALVPLASPATRHLRHGAADDV
ncbi:hypothetical protein HUW46_02926 [Amycolatopsis sp. CA-230715]|nr:hypothetical protein HUW46_02926 [Amycolatopsis sp. CA-230715]